MRAFIWTLSLFMLLAAQTAPSFAHEGHDHAAPPGTEENSDFGGTVTLSDISINNLGIETVKAVLAPRAASLDVAGFVEFLPERQAIVAARAAGRIEEINVKIGEKVSKGQKLLSVMPNFLGGKAFVIEAPIEGYITKQNIVIGQSITVETSLMEIGDSSQVLVRGILYETKEVSQVKVGQKVRVVSGLLGNDVLNGTVQRLDGAFDRGTRTFNLYALIDNPDRRLLTNMQVILSIDLTPPSDVLVIPAKAILGESGENFVFVRNGNDFERRAVKLGARFGGEREILEGLFPDEEIVTVGNYQLQFAKPAVKKDDPQKQQEHKH